MNTILVALAIGDEGKGAWSDYFTKTTHSNLTVRYTGGCQGIHYVHIDGKPPIATQHFGAGTVRNSNLKTVIAGNVPVKPDWLINEAEALAKYHSRSINHWEYLKSLYISEESPVALPVYSWLIKLREDVADRRSGTTGVGLHEMVSDIESAGSSLCLKVSNVRDMNVADLAEKISMINQYQFAKARTFDVSKSGTDIEACIEEHGCVWSADQVAETTKLVLDTANILSEEQIKQMISSSEPVVFEPAQGFFLDVKRGTVPFTTAMTTTMEPILNYLGDVGCGWPKTNQFVGVMSAHFNRHGGGPLVTETNGIVVCEDDNESSKYLLGGPRYGWLDLVALKHAIQTTEQWFKLDYLAVSHLDHLSSLDEVKVCTSYKGMDDKLPFSKKYETAKPVYQIFPGWGDLSGCKSFVELPGSARDYLSFIRRYLGIPIGWVGVGPRAEDRFAL